MMQPNQTLILTAALYRRAGKYYAAQRIMEIAYTLVDSSAASEAIK